MKLNLSCTRLIYLRRRRRRSAKLIVHMVKREVHNWYVITAGEPTDWDSPVRGVPLSWEGGISACLARRARRIIIYTHTHRALFAACTLVCWCACSLVADGVGKCGAVAHFGVRRNAHQIRHPNRLTKHLLRTLLRSIKFYQFWP